MLALFLNQRASIIIIIIFAVLWIPTHILRRNCAQDIKFNVHAHPTLSEVLDELFKQAHVENLGRAEVKPIPKAKAIPVAA